MLNATENLSSIKTKQKFSFFRLQINGRNVKINQKTPETVQDCDRRAECCPGKWFHDLMMSPECSPICR